MTNPKHCDASSIKNGKSKTGEQTYKCSICGRRFVDSPKKRGVRPIEGTAMSAAERKRKQRSKNIAPEN